MSFTHEHANRENIRQLNKYEGGVRWASLMILYISSKVK